MNHKPIQIRIQRSDTPAPPEALDGLSAALVYAATPGGNDSSTYY